MNGYPVWLQIMDAIWTLTLLIVFLALRAYRRRLRRRQT
jgi:hypothetical protein